MSKKRILSYHLSKKLSDADLQDISAAGTSIATANVTYGPQGTDVNADVNIDL